MCKPAIEMVRLMNAMPEAEIKFIMGVTEPAEAWSVLDRQYGNRDMAIALAIIKILALKIPKEPGYKRVEALLQGMCLARA